jgi:anti-sigma B factor antagonist
VIDLSTPEGDTAGAVHIAGELTVYHAAEAARDLLARIAGANAEAGPLALDLDGVTEFDSAGIQVLLVARQALVARGGSLQLLRPSRPVLDVIETFALTDLLAAPAAPTAATEILAEGAPPPIDDATEAPEPAEDDADTEDDNDE